MVCFLYLYDHRGPVPGGPVLRGLTGQLLLSLPLCHQLFLYVRHGRHSGKPAVCGVHIEPAVPVEVCLYCC